MIKVLIVDDEPLAWEEPACIFAGQGDIEIVGECSNAVEGIGAVHKLRPSVLFPRYPDAAHQWSGNGGDESLTHGTSPLILFFSLRLTNTQLKPL